MAPAEVICSSMIRGKTRASPASGTVPRRPTKYVSPMETADWKITRSTPGAESRSSVGTIGAERRRSEAGFFNEPGFYALPGPRPSRAERRWCWQPYRTPRTCGSPARPDELEADAHGNEARGIGNSGPQCGIEKTEPQHERAVREEVAQLVALREIDLGRRRCERQPHDG